MNTRNPKRPEDDPRLVAYVLGGLDEQEAAAVEALLAGDAEARQYVAEMRELSDRLEGELAAEPAHSLHPDQRAAVAAAGRRRNGRPPRVWLAPVLMMAAGLAVALTAWAWRARNDTVGGDPAATVRQVAATPSSGEEADAPSDGGVSFAPMDDPAAVTNPDAEDPYLSVEAIEEMQRLESLGYLAHGSEQPARDTLADDGSIREAEVEGNTAYHSVAVTEGLLSTLADGDEAASGRPLDAIPELRDNRADAGEGAEPPAEEVSEDLEVEGGDRDKDAAAKVPARTWKPAQATANASRLSIGDREDLPLKGMQARVQVDGFRARVLLDCWYYNDRDQQYEGTFKLRLPDGASPYCFAFGESVAVVPDGILRGDVFYSAEQALKMGLEPVDIMRDRRDTWKEPKEARMVPREKAAFAYGETVRRRVDPALMEWAGSGVFQARVFPLAPGALHRIVVGYDLDLTRSEDRVQFALDLPALDVPMTLDLDVAVGDALDFVVSPEAKPLVNGSRRQYHFEDAAGQRVTLTAEEAPPLCLTGSDADLGGFFAASFPVPVKAEAAAGSGAPRAVFLLDTSLSSTPDLFQVWARLLPVILEENQDSLREFAVLCFDVSSRWWRPGFVPNDAEHRAALAAYVDGLALEGATDLAAALHRAAHPEFPEAEDGGPHDLFLLSDGAATWGESEQLALSRALDGGRVAALYAYRTGQNGTDLRTLEHLARESGGAVFSVTGEDQLEAAARAHRQAPWILEGLTLEGCSDLLVQGRPAHVYPGQALVLTGRGTPAPDAPVVLELSRGDETRQVPVALPWRRDSPLAARAYGQVAVQQLETWAEATEDASKAYATHFRVTGRTCSLLMLETEADYERFGIRPEEDAFVIRRSPVNEQVAAVLADLAETLSSPKRRFLAFLDRLAGMPGMEFQAPTALTLALEAMPEDAFRVVTPVLDCRQEGFDGTPGKLQDLLAGRQVDYEMLVQEAERRLQAFGPGDALKALSSLVEVQPGDAVVARDVAFSALEWGLGPTAYHLLHRVAESRPYEPQTYWNLALCLEQMGQTDLALAWFEVAMSGQWDGRFGEVHRIVGVDYLRFLRRIQKEELSTSVDDYAAARARSLGESLGLKSAAVLITMQWNTDRTDVDLHVLEPTGEECYYSNRDTRLGGHLTQDVTQGFGPEMYTLAKATPGTYRVLAHYFASDQNRAGVRSKVYTSVYRDWGTEQETVVRRVITLERGKDKHELAVLQVK